MSQLIRLEKIINVVDFINYIDREVFNVDKTDQDDLVYVEPIIAEQLKFFECYYFIYSDKNKAGYCSVNVNDPSVLEKLYISPSYRRQGLASFVLNQLNIRLLYVIKKNISAIQLYLKNGFKISDRLKFNHAVFMEKL